MNPLRTGSAAREPRSADRFEGSSGRDWVSARSPQAECGREASGPSGERMRALVEGARTALWRRGLGNAGHHGDSPDREWFGRRGGETRG